MTASPIDRTVVPRPGNDRLGALLAVLESDRRPALVTDDGERVDLPEGVVEALHDVVAALSRGLAVSVAPRHAVLGTGEAVDLLGVSRPTVVRLLESGRIRLDDLLAYRARARRARAVGLDDMVRAGEDAGVYDLPDEASVERG